MKNLHQGWRAPGGRRVFYGGMILGLVAGLLGGYWFGMSVRRSDTVTQGWVLDSQLDVYKAGWLDGAKAGARGGKAPWLSRN